MMLSKLCRWIVVGATVVVMSGCGGGSSETVANPNQGSGVKTISGYVIDDPVAGATVEIYDKDGNLIGRKEDATDNRGFFSIDINQSTTGAVKIKAYPPNDEQVFIAYKNMDNDNDVYITPTTTAINYYLLTKNEYDASHYFELASELGLEKGEINNESDYASAYIKYVASKIEKAYKSASSYNAILDDNLSEKNMELSNNSIVDLSLLGSKALYCDKIPEGVTVSGTKISVSKDLSKTETMECISTLQSKNIRIYKFNIISSPKSTKTMSSDKRIANVNNIQIIKPSDDEIQIDKQSNDATYLMEDSDGNPIVIKSLLNFYPSGKKLKKPLTVKIPVPGEDNEFYLIDNDGATTKLNAEYDDKGYANLEIPHFSSVGSKIKGNLSGADGIRVNWDNVLSEIEKADFPNYHLNGDVFFPKILLDHSYYTSKTIPGSIDKNIDIKTLLELLVLKDGKGMFDVTNEKITYSDGFINISFKNNLDNEIDEKSNQYLDLATLISKFGLFLTSDFIRDMYDLKKNKEDVRRLLFGTENLQNNIHVKGLIEQAIEETKKLNKIQNSGKPKFEIIKQKSNLIKLLSKIDEALKIMGTNKNFYNIKNEYQLDTNKIMRLLDELSLYTKKMKLPIHKQVIAFFKKLQNFKYDEEHMAELKKSKYWKENIPLSKFGSNINKAFSGVLFGLKLYAIASNYNLKQYNDKITFLEHLKKIFPQYVNDIDEVEKELNLAHFSDEHYLKWFYAYMNNSYESVENFIDTINDLTGLASLASKTMGKVSVATDAINILGQTKKAWSGGNAYAYLSATASTMAYAALNNNNLTSEEKAKWYTLFQSLSNGSLMSWYYYAAKIEEKNNNFALSLLSQGLDAGLRIAAAPGVVGLATAAAGAWTNEVTVSAVWAAFHGMPFGNFNLDTDEIDFYALRNGDYKMILNGSSSVLARKKDYNFPVGTIYKTPDGKKIFSMLISRNDLSAVSVRLLTNSSNTYDVDFTTHKATDAYMADWYLNGKFYEKSGHLINGRVARFGEFNNKSDVMVINFALDPSIKQVELLGWYNADDYVPNGTPKHPKAYYHKYDLSKESIVDVSSESDRLMEDELDFFTTTYIDPDSDAIIDSSDNIKDAYQYAIDNKFTIFDLNTKKIVSATAGTMPSAWAALKYDGDRFVSKRIVFDGNRLYYSFHDYLNGKVSENNQGELSGCKDPLALRNSIVDMIEKSDNLNESVLSYNYFSDYFPNIDDAIECYSDKLNNRVEVDMKIYDTSVYNPDDVTSSYYDKDNNSIYIDSGVSKVVFKYKIKKSNYDKNDLKVFINGKQYFENSNQEPYMTLGEKDEGDYHIITITLERSAFALFKDKLDIALDYGEKDGLIQRVVESYGVDIDQFARLKPYATIKKITGTHKIGDTITLDASGSYDLGGEDITYSWIDETLNQICTTATCDVTLTKPSSTYKVTVRNESGYEASALITIVAKGTPPDNSNNISKTCPFGETLYPGHYPGMFANAHAFAAIRKDGSVVTWGDSTFGGDSSSVSDKLKDVKTIYSTATAFAALREDGTVVTWGYSSWGGDSSAVADKLKDVKAIYSTSSAFAALKEDGTVVTWGGIGSGGDSSSVSDKLKDVKAIYSTSSAFAALKEDGTVVTWGGIGSGGDSSSVSDKLKDVKTIYSSDYAFFAIKEDGTVITWGDPRDGGDSSSVSDKLTNIKAVFAYGDTPYFAGLREDGTVITWGPFSTVYDSKIDSSDVADNLKNIKNIFSTSEAFAALKKDGTVSTWTCGYVSEAKNILTGAKSIYTTGLAFASLKKDGTVETWGYDFAGGDSSTVADRLKNVKVIYSIEDAFAAVKDDGTVVTWGVPGYGLTASRIEADTVEDKLKNINTIYSTRSAFAAVKDDGTVVTWGDANSGGDSSSVADELHDVVAFSPSYISQNCTLQEGDDSKGDDAGGTPGEEGGGDNGGGGKGGGNDESGWRN